MSLTIQLPSGIEKQIRENAVKQGVSLEKLVTQLLTSGLNQVGQPEKNSLKEEELLQRIRLTVLSESELSEFYRLSALCQAEQLLEKEHDLLVKLSHRMEIVHADRLKYVGELAKLRGLTLREMMIELGLFGQNNAA